MDSSSGFAEAATMSLASMELLYIALECMSTENLTSNSNLQAPEKFQARSFKRRCVSQLEIGALMFLRSLGLGIWSFPNVARMAVSRYCFAMILGTAKKQKASSPLLLLLRVNAVHSWRRLLSIREQSRLLTGIIGIFVTGYLVLAFE